MTLWLLTHDPMGCSLMTLWLLTHDHMGCSPMTLWAAGVWRIVQVDGKALVADKFQFVTVLFTDLQGFTQFSSELDPKDLVMFLNIMYTKVRCACVHTPQWGTDM